jgi:hypothetical protein
MKFQSGVDSTFDSARKRFSLDQRECAELQELISVFMDSETSSEETALVHAHLNQCPACREELEALSTTRHFLASSEVVAPPENLALEARINLSRARHNDYTWRLNFLFADFIKPLAIRAVLSASVTAILFAALLLGFFSNQTLMASDADPYIALRQPARPTDTAKLWLAGKEMDSPPESLLIEAFIDEDGRATDFRVIQGNYSPEVDRWVWDHLYYAQFSPATSFGSAVPSSIILSFVAGAVES